MKLKRWEAVAENYGWGRFQRCYLKSSALKWLKKNSSFDVLYILDRWNNTREFIKDKLYGQCDEPEAQITQYADGRTEISYQWQRLD